jgi:hypothetical protein
MVHNLETLCIIIVVFIKFQWWLFTLCCVLITLYVFIFSPSEDRNCGLTRFSSSRPATRPHLGLCRLWGSSLYYWFWVSTFNFRELWDRIRWEDDREKWIVKELKGASGDLFQGTITAFAWRGWEESRKISISIADRVPPEYKVCYRVLPFAVCIHVYIFICTCVMTWCFGHGIDETHSKLPSRDIYVVLMDTVLISL